MNLNQFTKDNRKRLFLLLLLTAFCFLLLSNIKNLDLWYKTVCFTPATPGASAPATPGASAPATPRASARCSFTYLSPGNTEEGRRLVDSITWPETLPLPKPFSLALTSSASESTFSIVPRAGGWHVGEELEVTIHMKDFNGNPKRKGGDFLVSRLHNRQLGAGVVGRVQDHLNGTFSARFPLLWNGSATVEVMLDHPSEAISVLKRLRQEQPGRMPHSSNFVSGSVKEKVFCNICLDPHKASVCNFSDFHTGEPWFCFKPKTLDCNKRLTHSRGWYEPTISQEEQSLFQTGTNLKVYLTTREKTITVLPKSGSNEVRPGPAGFYFNNIWKPLGGAAIRQFNHPSVITSCLKGKQMHLFGDSTIRQYYEYLTDTLENLQKFDKLGHFQCGPKMAVDYSNDIVVTFRCHGPPIQPNSVPEFQLRYVANELDRVAGGPNTVIGIGVWAHLASYPLEVYFQRLTTIRRAVKRLQDRAPGTTVFVRTGNPRELNLSGSLTNSDWFSQQLNTLLRAVFRDSDVTLVEAWDMVQANFFPHNIHPPKAIVKLMVDQVLSLTCPEGGATL